LNNKTLQYKKNNAKQRLATETLVLSSDTHCTYALTSLIIIWMPS